MVRRQRAAIPATVERTSTRARIIEAALETLRDQGFGATSARSIARRGEFNQALIFYHFGSVPDLLLATLAEIAGKRLVEYRAAVAGVTSLASAIDVARRQYASDVDSGHITVLAELIAGASSMPELGPELVRCMEPWITFAEQTIGDLVRSTVIEPLIPPRDAATALVALYLGIELLEHLDPDAKVSSHLFRLGTRLASVLEPLMSESTTPSRRTPRGRRPQHVVITGPSKERAK